jgi:hypothetical protein
LVAPHVFRKGQNAVEVFVIREEGDGRLLTRGFPTRVPPLAAINLVSEEAQAHWQAELSGAHPLEGTPGQQFRWTSGSATVLWPLPSDERPRSIRIGLAPVARSTPLRVTYNGCLVLNDSVPAGGSYRSASLEECPHAARIAVEARIEIASDTFTGPRSDPRRLGLPIETLRLSSEPWPLPPDPSLSRGRVIVVEPPSAAGGRDHPVGTAVLLEVTNLGDRAWASAAEHSTPRPVRLTAMWRLEAGSAPIAGHSVDLPRALYPADRAQVWLRLDPPPSIAQSGRPRAEVSFELFEGDRAVELVEPGAPGMRARLR